jgi:hypothetical protein
MWAVAIVPLAVLAVPLGLQLIETRWVEPGHRAAAAVPSTVTPADSAGLGDLLVAPRSAPSAGSRKPPSVGGAQSPVAPAQPRPRVA